jgi:Ycf66 protein N-terminus
MVNASLNWASIVGIVLAVGGTLLYFLRSFRPALARDYDVFFAAVGLLCGGILFFQGWRLDPILQFGQFLLAATTVFFAYESVRLRSVTTEQARRSSFFDDDEAEPERPRMDRSEWGREPRFDEPQPLRRRIRSRVDDNFDQDDGDRDFYRPRRPQRPAIPERAQSRSGSDDLPEDGYSRSDSRSAAATSTRPDFGARRREREQREAREGRSGRPAASDDLPRSSRRSPRDRPEPGVPQGTPITDADFSPVQPRTRPRPSGGSNPDNSGRFDD